MKINIFTFFLINLGAFISALGTIFIKKLSTQIFSVGSGDQVVNQVEHLIVKLLSNYNFWFGGVCYVVPIMFWIYLLRDMEVTTLQPLLSVVYIYSIILAYFSLGETPTISKLVGMVLISIGVYFISSK